MRGGTQASALDKIATGNKGDVFMRRFHLILESGEITVSFNATVNVVFIEDDDILCRRLRSVFDRAAGDR